MVVERDAEHVLERCQRRHWRAAHPPAVAIQPRVSDQSNTGWRARHWLSMPDQQTKQLTKTTAFKRRSLGANR